jgi:hypothetical protein
MEDGVMALNIGLLPGFGECEAWQAGDCAYGLPLDDASAPGPVAYA